jgi:hypothetical protein
MGTVNFIYDYPYLGYGEMGKYFCQWASSQIRLNGCYTTPMVFNNTVRGCKHMKIDIEIENTGYGTIYGISWDFIVYRSEGYWTDIATFTLPDSGQYTIDCDIPDYNITQFAFVPTYNPGSSRTWTAWYNVEQLTLTETYDVKTPSTGAFHYGVFFNRYGLEETVSEVYANVNGSLVRATDVLANIDGKLKSVRPVYSDHYTSESETSWLYGFTPRTNGTYRIKEKRISGDHELRLYSSDFSELYDGYFYDQSFELTAGTLYYILVTHFRGADASESYLQIYKED